MRRPAEVRETLMLTIEVVLFVVLAVGAGLLAGAVLSPSAAVGVALMVGAVGGLVEAVAVQRPPGGGQPPADRGQN